MKLVNLVKSTGAKHTKYFLNHLHASFHIQSQASTSGFTIEPCVLLQGDDGSYYEIIRKATEQQHDTARALAYSSLHQVYVDLVGNGDDRDQYGGTYTYYITTIDPRLSQGAKTIFKDKNGEFYWVGDKLVVEKMAPELAAIMPTIDEAIAKTSARRTTEYQHAQMLFAQQKAEHERKKAEFAKSEQALREQQKALSIEAAQLAGDAMDVDKSFGM